MRNGSAGPAFKDSGNDRGFQNGEVEQPHISTLRGNVGAVESTDGPECDEAEGSDADAARGFSGSRRHSNRTSGQEQMRPITPKELMPGNCEQEEAIGKVLEMMFDKYKRFNIGAVEIDGTEAVRSQAADPADSHSGIYKWFFRQLERVRSLSPSLAEEFASKYIMLLGDAKSLPSPLK